MGKLQTVNPSHQCFEQQKWKLLDTVVPVALQFVQKCSELDIELLRISIFRLFSQQGSGQIHLTSVF